MHENGKEVFYMMGANGAVLFSLLIYAALLYGAVRLIKYFIRYGIDYYFEKLVEYQKNQKQASTISLRATGMLAALVLPWRSMFL